MSLQALQHGLVELGQTLPDGAEQRLLQFLELLQHWNSAFNLTAVRDIHDMVAVHLLDSLAIRPWLDGERILIVRAPKADVAPGGKLNGLLPPHRGDR